MEKAKIEEGFVKIETGSCIDFTTTDIFDLSADELRFRPSYDAVSLLLPPLLRPKVVASTTTQHGCSLSPPPPLARPPAAIKFLKPSQSPGLVLDNAYDGAHDVQLHDDHHDVIDVDDGDDDVIEIDDDDDDVIEVIDIDDDDDDDDDDRRDCSINIVASSVGSNDYVSDAMDDDAVTSRHHIN